MKKNSNVLVFLLTLTLLGVSINDSKAQFRKYRSKSKFNAKKSDAKTPGSQPNQNTKTFGARNLESPLKGSDKKTKYVQ